MILAVLALACSTACRDTHPLTPASGSRAEAALALSSSAEGKLIAATDFAEYPAGAQPSGWTERWTTSGSSWTVRRDTSGAFAGGAKLVNKVTTGRRHALSWDAVGSRSDARLHTRVRLSTLQGGWLAGLTVAGGGTAGAEAGYSWRFRNYNGFYGVELTRYVNGVHAYLGRVPFAFQANTFYHLMLEKQGDSLRAKVWTDGEPEPAWQVVAADTALPSGWVALDNYDDGSFEYDFLRVYEPAKRNSVPAVAPDTIPQWIYEPDNLVNYHPRLPQSWVIRNVVVLVFKRGTPQADRQAAVDLVGGEVIGGRLEPWMSEGTYYVRVEGDSTGDAVFQAAKRLRALPQVIDAGAVFMDYPENLLRWRLPNDAGEYQRDQWKVRYDPVLSLGATSDLELIDAPLGWGCSTGGDAAPVAVVDRGFQRIDDLAPNVGRAVGINFYSATEFTQNHGTAVAAILAARGDNGIGITGAMWNADLRLYDFTFDPATGFPIAGGITLDEALDLILTQIRQAAAEGARVINVSLGPPWPEGYQPGSDPKTLEDDRQLADRWAGRLRATLRRLAEDPNISAQPLIVVAAGNEDVNASWSGFPQLAQESEFQDRVLAVGAVTHSGGEIKRFELPLGIGGASNYGSLVQITAPGIVQTLDGQGQPAILDGTSAAAPLVSGVAGLLLSFDPSLTSDQLKGYLVEGAERSGRTMPNPDGAPSPVLNAYESLKAVAERPGAPLCGNRVWMKDGAVTAQRGGMTEELLSLGNDGLRTNLNPLHGGRRVRAFHRTDSGYAFRSFAYSDGRWIEESNAPEDPEEGFIEGSGAAFLSSLGYSHDADTLVVVNNEFLGSALRFHLGLVESATGAEHPLASVDAPVLVSPVERVCLRQAPEPDSTFDLAKCASGWTYHTPTDFQAQSDVAYAPTGDAVLFLVSFTNKTSALSEWSACPQKEWTGTSTPQPDGTSRPDSVWVGYRCRGLTVRYWTQGTRAYTIGIAQRTVTPLWEEPYDNVRSPGILETGAEFYATSRSRDQTYPGGWVKNAETQRWHYSNNINSYGSTGCKVEYRDIATNALRYAAPPCWFDWRGVTGANSISAPTQ